MAVACREEEDDQIDYWKETDFDGKEWVEFKWCGRFCAAPLTLLRARARTD